MASRVVLMASCSSRLSAAHGMSATANNMTRARGRRRRGGRRAERVRGRHAKRSLGAGRRVLAPIGSIEEPSGAATGPPSGLSGVARKIDPRGACALGEASEGPCVWPMRTLPSGGIGVLR
eukprot:scaffold122203_cov54-Phaeocystis_antarctica.AAC.1